MKDVIKFLLLLLIIVKCQSGPGPEQVLSNYLTASITGKHDEAYQYISSKDQLIKSFDQYIREKNSAEFDLSEYLGKRTSFKIVSLDVSGNTGIAEVDISMPDTDQILGDLIGLAFSKAFSEDEMTSEDLGNIINEKYSDSDIPITTNKENFNLVNEEDGWKVFLNLEVEELLKKADRIKENKELYDAMDLYTEALKLDPDNETAKAQMKFVQDEIKIYEEKQGYIAQIELYDFEARFINTYSDERVPAVRFKLKNNGNRTLNKVEVTVYFKDEDGTIIFEEDFNPVLVSEYSFTDNNPLKPNYIWQPGKGQYYTVEKVPDEWQTGSAIAKITDIEFDQ